MKRTVYIILTALLTLSLLSGCSRKGGDRDLIYEDMKDAYEKAGLFSSNIGIVSRTEEEGSISYGEFGSGVIIERKGSTYYALTAAHVADAGDSQLLVFTTNTDMKNESIPGMDDINILSGEVYDSMYPAESVYICQNDDLAVIRFESEEDLSVIETDDSDPEMGDRIMCVGNPQNEWFSVSCGEILSGIEKFGESTGYPSRALKHSAYIQVGSSGGAAIGEDMKLIGITPGAALSPGGKDYLYGVLVPVSEILPVLEEWKSQ
jgi:S1-C subfamily serine protease